MARPPQALIDMPPFLAQLTATGAEAPSLDEKVHLCQSIRSLSKEYAKQLDRYLVEQVTHLKDGLEKASETQDQLRALLDRVTQPPWHPAIFLGLAPTDKGDAAMVLYGNSRRIVMLSDEIDPYSLAIGDEVLLSNELSVAVGRSHFEFSESGEIALFERYTLDGRAVVKWRDEEVMIRLADNLRETALRSGDQIRWNRNALLALEKVERSNGDGLFLEDTPSETFDNIGGLERQIGQLQQSILLHMSHADIVRRYHLPRKGSVLLVGPPGTGKTMLARALANWLALVSNARRSHFMNIKPSQLHSMWFSQSEANYREAFRIARQASEEEPEVPVIIFFDEVDSVGAKRGDSLMQVNDRVLTALMAELDGLESRGNILVVAATNRRDALDPALLRPGRLGDLTIEVPRPNMKAARDIFAKYLHPDIPYADGGRDQDQAIIRQNIIESAVSRIYCPNGQGELAAITLRDGKRRVVQARELISGAIISKIALGAKEKACIRELETGDAGIRLPDILIAIEEECESLALVLSPANCHNHLDDLPQDVSVARVEPIRKRAANSHHHLRVA